MKVLHGHQHLSHPLLHIAHCVAALLDELTHWIPGELGYGVSESIIFDIISVILKREIISCFGMIFISNQTGAIFNCEIFACIGYSVLWRIGKGSVHGFHFVLQSRVRPE